MRPPATRTVAVPQPRDPGALMPLMTRRAPWTLRRGRMMRRWCAGLGGRHEGRPASDPRQQQCGGCLSLSGASSACRCRRGANTQQWVQERKAYINWHVPISIYIHSSCLYTLYQGHAVCTLPLLLVANVAAPRVYYGLG
ncbi:hypothetical protein TcCL_Unassigned03340 [Trypanosoma cruzi]|nr:hypothetical protein TcCL_Unassigned03340 [Trypanosoma cruzi]